KLILEHGDFATTLDLQDAFHHIRVSEQLLPYFGFKFLNKTYTYRGLPFGYRNSPYHFNMTLTLALREIRGRWQKLKISNYIDDIILLHPNKNQLKLITIQVIQYLQSLTWKRQQKKCRIYPSTTFIYLGQKWNQITIEVKMPQARRKMKKSSCGVNCRKLVVYWRAQSLIEQSPLQQSLLSESASSQTKNDEVEHQVVDPVNSREINNEIEIFGSTDSGIELSPIPICGCLTIPQILDLLKSKAIFKRRWNCKLYLNRIILGNQFNWLQKVKLNKPRQLEELIPSATLTTDAAEVGWGAVFQSTNLELMDANRWTKGWHLQSSNQREMAAVLMGIRSFKPIIIEQNIECLMLQTDNQTVEDLESQGGLAQQTLLERGLLNQRVDPPLSNELPTVHTTTRSLRQSNKQKMSQILLNIAGPTRRRKARSIHGELDKSKSPPAPSDRTDSKSPQKTEEITVNSSLPPTQLVQRQILIDVSNSDKSTGLGTLRDDTIRGQINAQTPTQTPARKPYCSSNDKYANGEQLFRSLASKSGLSMQSIEQLITNSNWETWRKRRQGLSIMADYMRINDIEIDELMNDRPDVHIVNAMAWANDMGGKNRKSKIISLKTHTSTALSQFSKMTKISDSLLIRNFSRCLNLITESKARYDVIWDIEILFNYIRQSQFVTTEEKQLLAMSLLVSFSAARMTELSRMTLKDIQSPNKKSMIINTQIKKGCKIRNEQIKLNRSNCKLCPISALQNWILIRSTINTSGDAVFWNFQKGIQASSYYCSQSLTSILRKAGIQQSYNGPSIRHACMTKLRSSGASVTEVNAFTRHTLTSTVVDA
ncbi:MAG: hypothetical protein EZS28_035091, partial [Streblomastix strix]